MKLRFLQVFFAVLILTAPAFAVSPELPSLGLEDRIDFWKKVFTIYGEDDVIIHDRFHVNLIYDVAGPDDREQRRGAVEQALDEIRLNLDSPETLSLIAKQIREAIASKGIPLTPSSLSDLRNNIHTQKGIKERFRQGIVRSGRYVDSFRQIFAQTNVPMELTLLPLVESSFENRALSKVGAAGIWQFTRSTGRLYMKVNSRVDERLNPDRATRAAVKLLSDNYKALGAWPLAITAYNHGRAGMMRAQDEVGSSDINKIISDYKGRSFGYASMNFYAEFLAAVEVYNSYPQYFGQLVLDKPATRVATPERTLAAAKTPAPRAATVSAADKYRVRKGDTLTEIARRFGTTVSELMDANNLRNTVIHAGQLLFVK
jgi:membrane-bound lytic murein transglycosylase D